MDVHLRRLLTSFVGYDYCVTEFIRVTDQIPPKHVIRRYCPELTPTGAITDSGVPVAIQFLGGDPEKLAASATAAVALGAQAIDLNFGCPAKTVNRHDGGASLLQFPECVHNICATVRRAVPSSVPVTAKMRLGFNDASLMLENAQAIDAAGLQRLAVHARTKVQGYKPPAHWEAIAAIQQVVSLPLVANGDINSVAQFWRCVDITGCHHYMLGRGGLSCPDLASQIRQAVKGEEVVPITWLGLLPSIQVFFQHCLAHAAEEKYAISRLKQWLRYLAENYAEARIFFSAVKRLTCAETITKALADAVADSQLDLSVK